jgi:hypothetical protein
MRQRFSLHFYILSTFLSLGLLRTATAQDHPTANCPKYPPSFFTQTLNHDSSSSTNSSSDTNSFQQQYQLSTTSFRPNGPILFQQGAESSSLSCVEYSVLQDWVEEMGGMIATLEHRYFGLSVPDGVDVNSTAGGGDMQNWAPLTMNNTLLDSVNFIEWVKRTVPGAENSKVIVLGGTYFFLTH